MNQNPEIETGTVLKDKYGNQRKILAVVNNLYCISQASDLEAPSTWLAYHQLAKQFDLSQLYEQPVAVLFFHDTDWEHMILEKEVGTDRHVCVFLGVEHLENDCLVAMAMDKIVRENWKFTVRQRKHTSDEYQVLLYPPNWKPGWPERRVPYNGYGPCVRLALIECLRTLLKQKYLA